jgi:hypothetical protein
LKNKSNLLGLLSISFPMAIFSIPQVSVAVLPKVKQNLMHMHSSLKATDTYE